MRFAICVFLIWNGTETDFDNIWKKVNEYLPSKFEHEMSKTEINFFDATVLKVDNKLRPVYVKPTERQSYLHRKSEDLNSLRKALPVARY